MSGIAPAISIIIPVYNVEPYLRDCLDSVVKQTLHAIQIICVDNGSTDQSWAILQEYAARDDRILILSHPGGRQGAARNAAYPYIKGEYTTFVDSDDWIDLDMCEQLLRDARHHNADMLVTQVTSHSSQTIERVSQLLEEPLTAEMRECLIDTCPCSACAKLYRSAFLLEQHIDFPEGLAYEDQHFHWLCFSLANKIATLNRRFYHYRQQRLSTTKARGKHHADIIAVFDCIKASLVERGLFETYRDFYIKKRLQFMRSHYRIISPELRSWMRDKILAALDADDEQFLERGDGISRKVRAFYRQLRKKFSWSLFWWTTTADCWSAVKNLRSER